VLLGMIFIVAAIVPGVGGRFCLLKAFCKPPLLSVPARVDEA
jgi:hypothetical protein